MKELKEGAPFVPGLCCRKLTTAQGGGRTHTRGWKVGTRRKPEQKSRHSVSASKLRQADVIEGKGRTQKTA